MSYPRCISLQHKNVSRVAFVIPILGKTNAEQEQEPICITFYYPNFGVRGKGIYRFSVLWTHESFYKLMYTFVNRLYNPGSFWDQSYTREVPQDSYVTYNILFINVEYEGFHLI